LHQPTSTDTPIKGTLQGRCWLHGLLLHLLPQLHLLLLLLLLL
jgi:hypothetical protein